jgi:nitrite reductase/ring-hydroxylating ferredoxin subunit
MADFEKVAELSDLEASGSKVVKIADRDVALFQVEGQVYAMDNACKHKGGPLGEGTLEGKIITCPWHGWSFDVSTGQCTLNASKVPCHEVKIEGTAILVKTQS